MAAGPTRAALQARVDELVKERDAWREAGPQDPEALAIARCVVALDKINPKPTSGVSYSYTTPEAAKPNVGRVLRYLATRYGVTWGES